MNTIIITLLFLTFNFTQAAHVSTISNDHRLIRIIYLGDTGLKQNPYNKYSQCEQLLKLGANPNILYKFESESVTKTALSCAVFRCYDCKKAVNFYRKENFKELCNIAEKNYSACLKLITLLLQYGADPKLTFEREGKLISSYTLAKDYYELPDVTQLFDSFATNRTLNK